MSTDPFSDDVLSAIIDGEADPETVASVSADPDASTRLSQMRRAVAVIATFPVEATPERRSASIAAAMAAATSAPVVSSLAAARHAQTVTTAQRARSFNPQWLALAAAAALLVVAIPLLARAVGTESADTASTADSSQSLDTAADDSVDDTTAETADDTEAEGATAESAAPEEPTTANDSASDDFMADDASDETAVGRLAEAPTANNLDILADFIRFGSLSPTLTVADVIAEGVPPDCVESLATSDEARFDLAILDEFGGAPRVVLISFADDGTSTIFDAEDCTRLG